MVDLTQLYFTRQHLHPETRLDNVRDVASSICGINAQRGVTIYFSFWNRMHNFRKRDLDKALYQTKELVKVWCMRGTVHIIPSDQLSLYLKATTPYTSWLPADVSHDLYDKIIDIMEEPLTKSEIAERLEGKVSMSGRELRVKVGRAVRGLGYRGMVVFGKPRGKGFYVREYEFALTERWLEKDDTFSEAQARRMLLPEYLKCYGPATIQDFAYWIGSRVGEARKVFDSVDCEEVKIGTRKYCIVPEDTPYENPDTPDQIVLLPQYDSYVMGHKDKSRIIAESYRSRVFLPYAEVAPTIVKNGRVIGTWTMKKDGNTLIFGVDPFEKLEEDDLHSIHSEMQEIAQFMGLDYRI